MPAVSQAAKARQAAAREELRMMYVSHGICPRCKSWAEPGHQYCANCIRKAEQTRKKRDPTGELRKAYAKARRERLKASGMCVYCGKKKAVPGNVLCPACKRKNSQSQEKYNLRQRLAKEAKQWAP